MKRVFIIVGIVVLIVAAGGALARTSYPHWGRWHAHGPLGFLGRQLDLSDEQKKQIQSIWQTESPKIAFLIRDFAAEQKQMNATEAEGNYDVDKIGLIANSQALTLAKLIAEKEKLTLRIYTDVLTPEQRVKANRWREQWPSRLEGVADRIAHAANEAPADRQ